MTSTPNCPRDFFVSFTQADRAWATWIAWALEEAGYTAFFQDWDFKGNFVLEMDKAHTQSRRTVAVLSPDYVASRFAAPEWAARFAQDATSGHDLLIPVRVRPCELKGLLGQIVYVDLVGCGEAAARDKLLRRVEGIRLKPDEPPLFPGQASHHAVPERPTFPADAPTSTTGLARGRWVAITLFCSLLLVTPAALVVKWPEFYDSFFAASAQSGRSFERDINEAIHNCISDPVISSPEKLVDHVSSSLQSIQNILTYRWEGGTVSTGHAPTEGVKIVDVYGARDTLVIRYDWENGRMFLRPTMTAGSAPVYIFQGSFQQNNGRGCIEMIFKNPRFWGEDRGSDPAKIATGRWGGGATDDEWSSAIRLTEPLPSSFVASNPFGF